MSVPSATAPNLFTFSSYRERKFAGTIGTVLVLWLAKIKYMEAILSNSTQKLFRFEITKMLITV